VVLVSFGLLAARWEDVKDRAELDSLVSREGAMLGVNVLFLALAFAVLLGTLFPLVVEAISGDRVTVGPPFFDQVTLPIWMLVLLLMGIGPLLPWRKAEEQSLRSNLAWMLAGLVVAGGLAWALGVRKLYPALTVGLAGYNVVSLGLLLAGALVPRMRLAKRPALQVLRSYAHENRRRVGSMVVHFAVVVIAVGVAFSAGYRVDEQVRLDIGGSAEFEGYTLTATELFVDPTAARVSAGVLVEVRSGDRFVTTLRPRINVFPGSNRGIPTPAVLYRPSHDLYLSLNSNVAPGTTFVVLRVVKSPLVTWIWVGGALLALGTAYALGGSTRRVAARVSVPAAAAREA
jgi:cytochrome c-type biogenesis protein CcmF